VASSSTFFAWALAWARAASAFFLVSLVSRSASGGGAGLVGLLPRGRDGPLGLLLGGGQHPLGLLARIGADPLGLLLRVGPLLADIVVGLALLRPGLVVRQLEDLGDPLADLLVRGSTGERLLAHGRNFAAQVLGLIEGPGEALLQFADLVVAARYEIVNLAAAVAAHLHLELFVQQVRQKVTVFIHGITRILCPESLRGR
jgi:hypothetical protein